MKGIELLRAAVESEINGRIFPAAATHALRKALVNHLETGEPLDRLLGLNGGTRCARTRLLREFMDAALFDAYSVLTEQPARKLDKLTRAVGIFAEGWPQLAGKPLHENADELFSALYRAFNAGLKVPTSRAKLCEAIDRHLARLTRT